jgi:nucleoside-diphosphate-sugar epimerase
MKCVVFGGTRFFGKKLVNNLVDSGHDVTIVTRGNTPDDFGSHVRRVLADRSNRKDLESKLGSEQWDVAFDQIGYSPDDAHTLIDVLKDRVGRLIFTSSQSVYDSGQQISEGIFDPMSKPIQHGNRDSFSYQEGKRLAEAVYHQKATFPVTSVRFPIVLGFDDYTRRLHFHIERIQRGDPIYFPSMESRISFIEASDAAKFLAWAATVDVTGPINACSPDFVKLGDLVSLLEAKLKKPLVAGEKSMEACLSPFGVESDWNMDTSRAQSLGFEFQKISDWMPALVDRIVGELVFR